MKNWVCGGLDFFLGAVGSLLCARGRRASGCGRSGGPLPLEIVNEKVQKEKHLSNVMRLKMNA